MGRMPLGGKMTKLSTKDKYEELYSKYQSKRETDLINQCKHCNKVTFSNHLHTCKTPEIKAIGDGFLVSTHVPCFDHSKPMLGTNTENAAHATVREKIEGHLQKMVERLGSTNNLCPERKVDKEQALRYNIGKLNYECLPLRALTEVAKVSTMGAEKYGRNNWKKGQPMSFMADALLRHLIGDKDHKGALSGETFDKESGCMHLAHIVWNALAMIYQLQDEKKYGKFNDLDKE